MRNEASHRWSELAQRGPFLRHRNMMKSQNSEINSIPEYSDLARCFPCDESVEIPACHASDNPPSLSRHDKVTFDKVIIDFTIPPNGTSSRIFYSVAFPGRNRKQAEDPGCAPSSTTPNALGGAVLGGRDASGLG
jgi:hypothetical protein